MLIHEVASLLGVSTDTVRYYEREGLMDDRHVKRMPNGACGNSASPASVRLTARWPRLNSGSPSSRSRR